MQGRVRDDALQALPCRGELQGAPSPAPSFHGERAAAGKLRGSENLSAPLTRLALFFSDAVLRHVRQEAQLRRDVRRVRPLEMTISMNFIYLWRAVAFLFYVKRVLGRDQFSVQRPPRRDGAWACQGCVAAL